MERRSGRLLRRLHTWPWLAQKSIGVHTKGSYSRASQRTRMQQDSTMQEWRAEAPRAIGGALPFRPLPLPPATPQTQDIKQGQGLTDSIISLYRSLPSRVRSPTPANTEKPPAGMAGLSAWPHRQEFLMSVRILIQGCQTVAGSRSVCLTLLKLEKA